MGNALFYDSDYRWVFRNPGEGMVFLRAAAELESKHAPKDQAPRSGHHRYYYRCVTVQDQQLSDPETLRKMVEEQLPKAEEQVPQPPRMRALSRNGRWLAVAFDDHVCVLDLERGELAHRMGLPVEKDAEGFCCGLVGLAISEDGRYAGVGYSFTKGNAYLLDFKKSKTATLDPCCDTIDSLAFSPDNSYLCTADAYQQFIVAFKLNRRYRTRPSGSGMARRPALPIAHCQPVRALAFTPDGKYLISAGADGQIILWDATTFERKATLMLIPRALDGGYDWAAYTPQGELRGSEGVGNYFNIAGAIFCPE